MSETGPVTTSMIAPFRGDGDLVAWLTKVKLVARLKKITDLASFVPLYLEGDALALYLEMSETEQKCVDSIEKKLKTAYTDGLFTAYGKLTHYKWTGECIDVYASEIRKLAGLAGFQGDGLKRVVKLQFVIGLPNEVAADLQQVPNIESVEMSVVIERARVLVANRKSSITHTVNVAANDVGKGKIFHGKGFKGKCFICGGPHMARVCEEKGDGEQGRKREFDGKCFVCGGTHIARYCPEKSSVTCYKCGKPGHISPNCSQLGNE